MTIYFAGNEDSDFAVVGTLSASPSMSTTASTFRSVARGRLIFSLSSANQATAWLRGLLPSTYTNLWATCRNYFGTATNTSNLFVLGFGKGAVRRLGLAASGTSGKLSIVKVNAAGTVTTLATEAGTYSTSTLYKFDVQVINFGASGTVNVYRANADGSGSSLIMTYTGDLTTDGITDLDSLILQGHTTTSTNNGYSEVIASDNDTRGMGLVTLEPTSNGNTYNWSGSYTDVNESTLNDATLINSTTNNDIAQFAFNSSRIGTPSAVIALVIAARGQAGGGLSTFTPNVRVASTDYYGTGLTPGTGLKAVQGIFYTNPSTGLLFTSSELTTSGVNYGFRANT